jgi:carbon-monoxide dehydrogenase medium subunit
LPGVEMLRPRTVEEAIEALSTEGAMLLAGGSSLATLISQRLVEASVLVWVSPIEELHRLEVSATGDLWLGASLTMREVAQSTEVRRGWPLLAEAAGAVGNPRVRAVATIGGALAHADPRQDLPPALLALGASVVVAGPNGRRTLALADLLVGFMETSLRSQEVIVAVTVPGRPGWRGAYRRFTPASSEDYPTVSVAADLSLDASGKVVAARLAAGSVDATARSLPDAAAVLVGLAPTSADLQAAGRAAVAACQPSDDHRGSKAYKRAMLALWVERTVRTALETRPAR